MSVEELTHYKFNEFAVDAARRLLVRRGGEVVSLTPKVFDLLLYLVRNPGRTIEKDEIMSAVWPETIVEESNLTQNISILRRSLGETRGENEFIATVPGMGYRFVAEVEGGSAPLDSKAAGVSTQVPEPRRRIPIVPLAIGAGLLIAVIAAAAYVYLGRYRSVTAEQTRVLAILPFKPLMAEGSDPALEIGMADTLIAKMSNTSGLVLRPLTSVRKFSSPDQDPQSAGRELGADTVLDGNIQRQGEKIRVNVRLIDVASGEAIWGGTFDDEYRDIFAVQDAISSKVAEALRVRLHGAKPTSGRGTDDLEAYRLYLQARFFQFKSTPQEVRRAINFYQEAIAIDPKYAMAYAGVADAFRTLPITSDVAPASAFPQSKAAALKALELDDQLSQAHVMLGYVASWYEWDWKTAETEMRRGVTLDPNSADAHRGLSILLTLLGRHDEAIAEMKAAREIDPLSLPTNALEAQALHYAGRDAEAVERLNKTFEIDPNFWIARLMLARIYVGQSRFEDALAELERARAASGGNTEAISLTGYVYAKTGRRDEAMKTIEQLRQRKTDSFAPSYNLAMVYNALGETDKALDELTDAVEQRDVRLILLNVDHKWDNLRRQPRFIEILKRMKFAE
ncbi:MAG: tetratricopeptide repeat protein [Acidobacteriota bacterium]